MEGFNYAYPPTFPQARTSDSQYPDYPDHGDGFGEYYGLGPLNEEGGRRAGRSKRRPRNSRSRSLSKSKSRSRSHSKERNRSKSRSQSRSRTRSRSRSRSKDRSASGSRSGLRHKDLSLKEPSFLDAFRVLYLSPSKHQKNTAKYLATQKRQDRVQEFLKSDGLGSKHWFFYPRKITSEDTVPEVRSRETCDQRVKVDGDFFRKYKRSKKIDTDAPIAKLKRWELVLYKKLGFVQAV